MIRLSISQKVLGPTRGFCWIREILDFFSIFDFEILLDSGDFEILLDQDSGDSRFFWIKILGWLAFFDLPLLVR